MQDVVSFFLSLAQFCARLFAFYALFCAKIFETPTHWCIGCSFKKVDGDKNWDENKTKQSETLPNQNPDHGISSEANATANWHVREIDERHDVRVDEEVVDERCVKFVLFPFKSCIIGSVAAVHRKCLLFHAGRRWICVVVQCNLMAVHLTTSNVCRNQEISVENLTFILRRIAEQKHLCV